MYEEVSWFIYVHKKTQREEYQNKISSKQELRNVYKHALLCGILCVRFIFHANLQKR